MRKTGLYGYDSEVNFEWPKVEDLKKMVKNLPTGIKYLKYQRCTMNTEYFGAFQLTLSNGLESPIFNASGTNGKDLL